MQNAVTANGNGTLLNVNEYATAVLEVRGTFSATINFECSIDDTNWYSIVATKNDGTISSSCTTVGLYEIKVAAWKSIRARVSGYVSGSITVIGKVSPLVNSEKSMQLTGRNVEEIVVFNALAITSTTAQTSNEIGLSKYKDIFIYAYDTHNQDITASVQLESGNIYDWSGSAFGANNTAILSVDAARYDLTSKWSFLKARPLKYLRFRAAATVAPTSGSLTLKIWGVLN